MIEAAKLRLVRPMKLVMTKHIQVIMRQFPGRRPAAAHNYLNLHPDYNSGCRKPSIFAIG